MNRTQKLTKKQKKALAFRERGKGSTSTSTNSKAKTKDDDDLSEMEARAIPVMEEQDQFGDDGDQAQVAGDEGEERGEAGGDSVRDEEKREKGQGRSKGKGKAEAKTSSDAQVLVSSKKRKRKEDGEGEEAKGKESGGEKEGKDGKTLKKRQKTEDAADDKKQRFILFVGNLKYTTTKELISAHFAHCDPPPTVRLLTPKSTSNTAATQKHKSKGCAFLEFNHRNALQQGLKLHHSTLDGRMINVELTAGGGGKSDARLTKLRERNKALLGQRNKKLEKEGKEGITTTATANQQPQRYSATSGVGQTPASRKTWAVADDDGQTHRGGKSNKPVKKARVWGTGVNAIPVG